MYQAGEALRFDENAINIGVKGILNVMSELNIIQDKFEPTISPISSKDTEWIIAHKGGVLHSKVSLGQTISKNELLGTITDPFGSGLAKTGYFRPPCCSVDLDHSYCVETMQKKSFFASVWNFEYFVFPIF